MSELWLTTAEAARLAHVSERTVRAWVAAGHVRGHRGLIEWASLDQWRDAREHREEWRHNPRKARPHKWLT